MGRKGHSPWIRAVQRDHTPVIQQQQAEAEVMSMFSDPFSRVR